jgi:hypothetical protein
MSEEEQIPKGWEIAILEDMLYYVQPISVHKKNKAPEGRKLNRDDTTNKQSPRGAIHIAIQFHPAGV